MRRLCVQLRHADGGQYRWISILEAQELLDKGDAFVPKGKNLRGKPHKRQFEVQLIPVPSPSKVPDSTCALTADDAKALAGMTEISDSELKWLRRKQFTFKPLALPVVYV